MRLVSCVGKSAASAKGGKPVVVSAKKNVQSVSSAGKDAVPVKSGKEATGAKLEKARNWAKRRKIHNRCQARENK